MAQKKKFSLKKFIYNDKYLIIVSILIAIVIWMVTSINLSPTTTKTITVPVTVDFSDTAADQMGLTCFGETTIDVDVSVSCKKYLAKEISADDIDIVLQSNIVTSTGSYDIPIRVSSNNSDATIESYYPTTYTAYFDVSDSKSLPIELDYENEDFIADGYTMGEAILSESNATVTGPKSYISQVDSVVASVNIDDKIDSTQTVDITAVAYDSNGNSVKYVTVDTGSEQLSLTIPVYKTVELSVVTNFTEIPSEIDVSDFKVTYNPTVINCGVLEDADISEANFGDIPFNKLTVGTNEFEFSTSSLNGILLLEDVDTITASVVVPSTYDEQDIDVSASSVQVINLPDGYKAKVNSISSTTVTAVGIADDVAQLSSDNVLMSVDMSAYENEIKTGKSEYVLDIVLDNVNNCWIYGEYTATVTITQS